MSSAHEHPQPAVQSGAVPGLSGKQVTTWVVAALVVIGIVLSYTLWTYNRLDDARRAAVVAWREVTEQLSERYRVAERTVAEGVDERRLQMEYGEQFRLAIDAFRTTSLPEKQFAAAERVEQLLAQPEFADAGGALPQLSDQGRSVIENFNQAKDLERRLLESWGGRFLDIFLKFESPRPFVYAGQAAAKN